MPRLYATLFLSGLFSLTASLPAWGQASAIPPLTVDDAVRIAVSRNPRLEAAVRDIRSASSGVRSARALTNPTVLFTPGITSISGTGEEFIAQQPLELNGTRQARTAVANAELRGTRAQSVIALRDTVYQTKVAYYGLAQAQRRAAISRELLAVAVEADSVARKQVEEGARAGIDLAQTGIEVSRAEREVTLADGTVAGALATFNTLLARDPQEPVPTLPLPDGAAGPGSGAGVAPGAPVPDSGQGIPLVQSGAPQTLPPGTPAVPSDSLLTRAISARGETQSAVALRDRYRAEAALARAEGRPDIAPQVRVGYFTRGSQPASEGNGAGIGVALTLPLFDNGSRRNRVRQAEEAERAQDARVVAAQNDIRQEVAQAQARLRSAEAVLLNYRGGVLERAKRLLGASQLGFREGRVTVVALLEAQRSYVGVQNEYAAALSEVATSTAALERATGTVPETLMPTPAAK